MIEERNRFKMELKKRDVTIDDLRMFEAWGIATVFKEDWTIEEIADHIYYGKLRYFNWDDDDFINKIERKYIESEGEEWFYNTYLDILEKRVKEVKEIKHIPSSNHDKKIVLDVHKLHLSNDKRDGMNKEKR